MATCENRQAPRRSFQRIMAPVRNETSTDEHQICAARERTQVAKRVDYQHVIFVAQYLTDSALRGIVRRGVRRLKGAV